MAADYWLLLAIGVLIAVLAVLARWATKGRQPTDYYSLFLGGVVWLIFGIAMKSTIFLAGAVILLIIGFAHRKEWKKNPQACGKNATYALAAGFIVAFILAITLFNIPESLESKAMQYCGKENVAAVHVCSDYIEVVSSLLGGGSTYYRSDGTTIVCPVVGPDSMSPECKAIYEAKLKSSYYCKDICAKVTDFESCAAAGNPVMESYPRQCRANGITYTEIISDVIECLPEQRNAEVCTADYTPVCAKVNIQCIRAPCNPIDETFSNSCVACRNPLVESYRMGECG